jgi:hypothetical protein
VVLGCSVCRVCLGSFGFFWVCLGSSFGQLLVASLCTTGVLRGALRFLIKLFLLIKKTSRFTTKYKYYQHETRDSLSFVLDSPFKPLHKQKQN